MYMLQDNKNRLLARCSPSDSRKSSAKQMAMLYARFPAGLIRGALNGLSVMASVNVEVSEIPACQFTIKIQTPESPAA